MLRNPSSAFGCKLHEGETGEIEQSLAETLVKMSVAVILEQPKKIQAVPDPPAIIAEPFEQTVLEVTETQPHRGSRKTR